MGDRDSNQIPFQFRLEMPMQNLKGDIKNILSKDPELNLELTNI